MLSNFNLTCISACWFFLIIPESLLDPVVHSDVKQIQTGIPEEAFNLECPDLQFKVTVLEQFILLDGKYVEKLNELEQQNSDILR